MYGRKDVMTLKELRKSKGITQKQAAEYVGVPERTYFDYEKNPEKQSSLKYKYIMEKMYQYGYIDEENGILTIDKIKDVCVGVLKKYKVGYCYLFGSYAKGKATKTSDVDLLVYTEETGLNFYGMVEELRNMLKKNVDVLNQKQIENNFSLTNEILKDGIKVYG